jgi:hypothetical protein
MAVPSGISAAPLQAAFARLSASSDRALFCYIVNESIEPGVTVPSSGSDADDFALLDHHLEKDQACYILYRTSEGFLLITYVPDPAPVRAKMLYCKRALYLYAT